MRLWLYRFDREGGSALRPLREERFDSIESALVRVREAIEDEDFATIQIADDANRVMLSYPQIKQRLGLS